MPVDCDTIAAIATPVGSGGIGIIKISGKNALTVAAAIFRKSNTSKGVRHRVEKLFESHRLYHGHIIDPDNQMPVDEVLLAVMLAPRSYTREDIVEIQAHSGTVVLQAILQLVLKHGARLAEPGEFTKRAFLNGRIDLTQAEAVIDVIHARTQKSLRVAATHMSGILGTTVLNIKETLVRILSEIEAGIDFPDDIGDFPDMNKTTELLQTGVIDPLQTLSDRYDYAHVLRDGIKLIVVGRPNVGKSSLINRLLCRNRVIVTSVPGTTRDVIEEPVNIHGIPVILTDSAGLHQTDDPVETVGIKMTQKHIDLSDLVLFMIESCNFITEADLEIYEKIKDRAVILVLNKIDLVDAGYQPVLPEAWHRLPNVRISALYDQGLDQLKNLISRFVLGEKAEEPESDIIPNLRHKIAVDRGLLASRTALEGIRFESPLELIAIDIREAIDCLGEIVGDTAKEEILDEIFSRFCIGK